MKDRKTQPLDGNSHLWSISRKYRKKCSFTLCKLRFFAQSQLKTCWNKFFIQPWLKADCFLKSQNRGKLLQVGKYITPLLLLLIGNMLLSGCTLLFPAKPYNPTLYRLDSPVITPANKKSHLSILVLPTIASPEVNTQKMAYAPAPHQIAYYAKNRWVAMPTQMLLPLITETLRKNGYFYAVVPAPFAGKTSLILYTQLLALEQDFTTHPSTVHMTLAAQLISVDTSKILGAHQFSVIVPTPEDNPAGGAFAANQATAKILQELTQFCVRVSDE